VRSIPSAAVDELRRHGDQWGLDEELPEQSPGELHSTPKGFELEPIFIDRLICKSIKLNAIQKR